MEDKKIEKDIKVIRKENVSRDKIALQSLIRITALERLLLAKGVIDETDLAKEVAQVAAEITINIKKETGVTNA